VRNLLEERAEFLAQLQEQGREVKIQCIIQFYHYEKLVLLYGVYGNLFYFYNLFSATWK